MTKKALSDDLSFDTASKPVIDLVSQQHEDSVQRRAHKNWVIWLSAAFVVVMVFLFGLYILKLVNLALDHNFAFGWPVLGVASALIAPPTLILFALTRSVFRSGESQGGTNDDAEEEFIASKISSIVEMAKKMKEVV